MLSKCYMQANSITLALDSLETKMSSVTTLGKHVRLSYEKKSLSYVRHLTAEYDARKLPGLCVEESAGGNGESTVGHQMDFAGKYWIMIGILSS